ALGTMAAVAGYAIYHGNQIRPDVAFADLPPAVQQQLQETVAEGRRALEFGAIGLNDAFDYFARAYALHRNNPDAIAGLESVARGFLGSLGASDAGTQRNVLKKLYCQDYLSTYAPVSAACTSALGAAHCSA